MGDQRLSIASREPATVAQRLGVASDGQVQRLSRKWVPVTGPRSLAPGRIRSKYQPAQGQVVQVGAESVISARGYSQGKNQVTQGKWDLYG